MTRTERIKILSLKLTSSEVIIFNEKMKERVNSWRGKKPCSKQLLTEFELAVRQQIIQSRISKAEEKSRLEKQEGEEYSLRCKKDFVSGIHSFWDMDEAPLEYIEELKKFQNELLQKEEKCWWKLFHKFQKKMDVKELVSNYIQVLENLEKFVGFCKEIDFPFGKYEECYMREHYVTAEELLVLYKKNANEIINS